MRVVESLPQIFKGNCLSRPFLDFLKIEPQSGKTATVAVVGTKGLRYEKLNIINNDASGRSRLRIAKHHSV